MTKFLLYCKIHGEIHLILQALCVLSYIYFMMFQFSFIESVTVTVLGFGFVGGIIVSAYQHRYCSHFSWKMPRILEIILASIVPMTLSGMSMFWAAIHKEHHKYVDTERDPHGHARSFWENLNVFNYPFARRSIPTVLARDWLYRVQLYYYWEIAIILSILWCMIFDWRYLISLIALSYIYQVSLNLVGHTKKLHTRENDILAIIWGGELYHSSHHNNWKSAKFGKYDWPYFLFIKPFSRYK